MKNALTLKNVILVLSLLLNALGGTGQIEPVIGGGATPPTPPSSPPPPCGE